MLKGIDARLNAEVLYALRAMGHGDTLVLADMNFPAYAIAEETVFGEVLRMDNLTAGQSAEAILSVMPLDTYVDDFAMRMTVIGDPGRIEPCQAEVQAAIDKAEGFPRPMIGIERFAFYEAARNAFAVILTGETRFYGDFIFRKGVVAPSGD